MLGKFLLALKALRTSSHGMPIGSHVSPLRSNSSRVGWIPAARSSSAVGIRPRIVWTSRCDSYQAHRLAFDALSQRFERSTVFGKIMFD